MIELHLLIISALQVVIVSDIPQKTPLSASPKRAACFLNMNIRNENKEINSLIFLPVTKQWSSFDQGVCCYNASQGELHNADPSLCIFTLKGISRYKSETMLGQE